MVGLRLKSIIFEDDGLWRTRNIQNWERVHHGKEGAQGRVCGRDLKRRRWAAGAWSRRRNWEARALAKMAASQPCPVTVLVMERPHITSGFQIFLKTTFS